MQLQPQIDFTAPLLLSHFTAKLLCEEKALSSEDIQRARDEHAIVAPDSRFAEVFLAVAVHEQVLVGQGDEFHGVITRDCAHTVIGRCWLFGIITGMETRLRHLIQDGDLWRQLMSPERIEKARALKNERRRRGHKVDTLQCVQFGDVGLAAARHPGWRSLFPDASRRQAKKP